MRGAAQDTIVCAVKEWDGPHGWRFTVVCESADDGHQYAHIYHILGTDEADCEMSRLAFHMLTDGECTS